MAHVFVESPDQRLKRFQSAKSNRSNWIDLFEEAYSLALPRKDNFFTRTHGEDRTSNQFDATAAEGVQSFANNIQATLMPPFRKWGSLKPGPAIPKDQAKEAEKALQEVNDVLFNILNESNLNLVVNESFQDLAISTGIILVQEGPDINDPIQFTSVPMHTVMLEGGPNGTIDNFWREIEVPPSNIQRMWPKAELTADMRNRVQSGSFDKVKLVEGTIHYPQNPEESRFFYYVQDPASSKDIFTEFRSFSPWIGFRFNRAPDEVFGRGPVITGLPFIRILNKMAEFELRNAKFRLSEMWLAESDSVFNPYNVRMEPGAIIPVASVQNPPLVPLPKSGDVNFSQLSINELRQTIKAMLFMDPLGPVETSNQTATEISIRQQNFIRRAGTSFGRLMTELISPIIDKTVKILIRKGIIGKLNLDGQEIKIKFLSPLAEVQNAEDINRAQQWYGMLANVLGPQALAGITDIKELPEWAAEKFGVDQTLVQSKTETAQTVNDIMENLLAQQQQPEQGPLDQPTLPPQVPQPGAV